jgi:uncharacterized protein (DUF1778 family)
MPKTINVRIENNIYEIFQKAAHSRNKTVAGYIKYAALNYTAKETSIDEAYMSVIAAVLDTA